MLPSKFLKSFKNEIKNFEIDFFSQIVSKMLISVTILITQRHCQDTTNIKDGKLCFATIFDGF